MFLCFCYSESFCVYNICIIAILIFNSFYVVGHCPYLERQYYLKHPYNKEY